MAQAAASNDGLAPAQVDYAYELDGTVEEKTLALAKRVYGAEPVSWSAEARRRARFYTDQGWGNLPSARRARTCPCPTTRR